MNIDMQFLPKNTTPPQKATEAVIDTEIPQQVAETVMDAKEPLLEIPETLYDFIVLLKQYWPDYWHDWLVWLMENLGFMLAAVLFILIPYFIFRAWMIRHQLARSVKMLKKIKKSSSGGVVDLDQISNQAMTARRLSHPWEEYMQTLHAQEGVDAFGQKKIVQWRSTAMSEVFFTDQVLVDTPLKTEFYKHLPGILTSIGIIGTFSGLIIGLSQFSTDQAVMRESLAQLVKTVGHAFQVSAAAIMLAIVFTFVEKISITICYRHVEKLCQMIDSFFSSGAGEEYLLRLVQSSETSAAQVVQLKDAFVSEIGQMFSGLAIPQVHGTDLKTQHMFQNLTKVFADTLREPMDRISNAVTSIKTDQGDAIKNQEDSMKKLLADVMADSSFQMRSIFGEQMQSMNEMFTQTTAAMRAEISNFSQLSAQTNAQNAQQSTELQEGLTQAVNAFGSNQGDAIQKLLTNVLADSSFQMRNIFGEQLQKMNEMMIQTTAAMRAETIRFGQLASEMESSSTHQTSKLQTELSYLVESLGNRVENVAEVTKASAVSVSTASVESIERMNVGADNLMRASFRLSDSLNHASTTMKAIGELPPALQTTADALATGSTDIRQMSDAYKATTVELGGIVHDLKETVELARKEASLTNELVSQLHTASRRLSTAQGVASNYLENVSGILEKSHKSFAKNMMDTLRVGNAQFHTELSTAVGYLQSAIMDLGDMIDSVGSIKEKRP